MADQKKISGLIKSQFPEFYHEEGPVFIDFVTAYYDWLESKTDSLNAWIKPNKSSILVVHGSANVIGSNTTFLSSFSAGDKIAIERSNTDYEIFSIAAVTNNTFLTLSDAKSPKFAVSNAAYGNVALQANPGYYVRRTQDSLDVDTTTDEFMVWFKEMYLKNIQFKTITDTKTLIKHSLDLYRSKGTPRSVDLLFKIAFGVPADIFYPAEDIFTTSSGNWHVPRYLELAPRENNILLENQQIEGLKSGATAFCDAVVRKTIKGKLIDVAYISAINGNFITNELISPQDFSIPIESSPLMIGSLNNLIVTFGGQDFVIGDTVDLYSNGGEQAKARVANVETATGTIGVTLTHGGYGYSNNSVVLVSEKILTLSNVQVNTSNPVYFDNFEVVSQSYANITYTGATGVFANGDTFYTYHANNDLMGVGRILLNVTINSTAGELTTTTISGDINSNTYYSLSNTANFTKGIFTGVTATGEVMGYYANVVMDITNITGAFETGEKIYQANTSASGSLGSVTNLLGSNATVRVISDSFNGLIFNPSYSLIGLTSGATANIENTQIQIGLKNVNNDFTQIPGNFISGDTSFGSGGVNATVSFVSFGEGFSFNVVDDYYYEEYVSINTDLIADYLDVLLSANEYGFPADPSGNATSNTIANLLTNANTKIGRIKSLTNINPGVAYSGLPIVKILDPFFGPFLKPDTVVLNILSPTAGFSIGELITQANSDFRGIIEEANSTTLTVGVLRFEDSKTVVTTTSEDTKIVGTDTGASANVESIVIVDTEVLSNNAIIDLSLTTANGIISELEIKDSGFGFLNGESVFWELQSNNSQSNTVTGIAIANTNTHGTASGFYKTKDGFVSNIKKLQDGEYWQHHSYEVRSSVDINKYEKMLKQVVHVAGHAMFGNLVYTSTTNTAFEAVNSGSASVVSYEYSYSGLYWFLPTLNSSSRD